jgi:hypothetical protein
MADNLTTFKCRLSRNSGVSTSGNSKVLQVCSRKALPLPWFCSKYKQETFCSPNCPDQLYGLLSLCSGWKNLYFLPRHKITGQWSEPLHLASSLTKIAVICLYRVYRDILTLSYLYFCTLLVLTWHVFWFYNPTFYMSPNASHYHLRLINTQGLLGNWTAQLQLQFLFCWMRWKNSNHVLIWTVMSVFCLNDFLIICGKTTFHWKLVRLHNL